MTSLIKSQIIKHLSKFARNVTPNQISVQILSGKGELKNIELNEVVLTEVLELPTWLRIKCARCNRVAVKVPWTRLKTSPVQLFVDEIQVDVELTSEAPPPSGSTLLGSFGESSYGFANRVVEGMSLYVNTVEIHFDSGVFGGSLMLSRLSVESRSPGWQPVADLRYSRITDTAIGQMLMFKQVSWQLLRIEASAQTEPSQRANINAPLRLITSSGKSRILVKKSVIDGTVLGGRIQTILDDILWVATLPQVRSAIAFYSHILKLVKNAPKKADVPVQPAPPKLTPTAKPAASSLVSKAFRNFDFEQTSYHFYVGRIDLHLCDDVHASAGYPDDWDIESGALQVTLIRLSIDFYPSYIATLDRSNWVRYTVPNQCSTWIHEILDTHYRKLCSRLEANAQNRLARIWPQLLSQVCVVRIHDVVVQCVTDANSKRDAIFNLFMSDRKSKASPPSDQPLVHLEFTSFYHPATENMPLPSNVTHLLLDPFSFVLDQRTVRWVLYVYEDIRNALQSIDASLEIENIPKSDVRVDFLMPKIIIPLSDSGTKDARLPRRVIISMSTVLATNCGMVHSRDTISFFKSLSPSVLDFIEDAKLPFNSASFRNFVIGLNQSGLVESDKDEERFWISTSPIWIDTDLGESTRPAPLVGDVALNAIVEASLSQINIAIQPQCRVRMVVDHFQYVQLTRLITSISLFVEQIEADQKFFSANHSNGNAIPVALIFLVDQIEVNIILARGAIASPYDLHFERVERKSPSLSETTEEDVTVDEAPPPQLLPQASSLPVPNRNEFETFPEFPQPVDNDPGGLLDETMSIATNASDDDQQYIVLDTPDDDVFTNADIAVGEEATVIDESIRSERQHKAGLTKRVNVLIALLDNVNIVACTVNKATNLEGYSSKVVLSERLDESCGQVYSLVSQQLKEDRKGPCSSDYCDAQLRFQFCSPAGRSTPSLKAQLQGLMIDLDDEIVSHLAPFILDEERIETPLNLRVNVSDTRLLIEDNKKGQPVRIRLNDCVIEKGDDELC